MKTLITLFSAIALTCLMGCVKDPIQNNQTNNPKFEVSYLFEQDGIKVYRFYDDGRYHYFTKNTCTTLQSCGKNCHYEETVESK